MNISRYLTLGLAFIILAKAGAASVLEESFRLEDAGQFTNAEAMLAVAIADKHTAPSERRELEKELDRLPRIRLDYPHTREALFEKLKASVSGLTKEEFEGWIAAKRFDVRVIDGQERFMATSVANLFWRYPELNPRRTPPKLEEAEEDMWKNAVAIKQAVKSQHTPYVLPKTFEVTMTVTVASNYVPAGETIRAWLPIPRKYAYQDGFELISSSPTVREVAPETSTIRSVYMEQVAPANAPAVFKIVYHYATRGVWFDVRPDKVVPFDGKDTEIAKFTKEAPHVVFTPEMKALSAQILGEEKNPARQAKMFYDWISTNIQYSFSTEYGTLRNISEYTRSHHYGDCGQEALFFITLCRLNGIPARWQSGWDTFPGAKDMHDWSEIYLAPYGWIPVDPCMGILATQYAPQIPVAHRKELTDFYFGGRGQWRMAANGDHTQELQPPKLGFRSDDVDFQRGELEFQGTNIYLNHYKFQLDAKELSPQGN